MFDVWAVMLKDINSNKTYKQKTKLKQTKPKQNNTHKNKHRNPKGQQQ